VTGRHCQSSFTDPRRMILDMYKAWGRGGVGRGGEGQRVVFDMVILDYFFCPVSSGTLDI
jgi:hypothetical protein